MNLAQVPVTPDQVHRALTTQDYTTIGVLVVGFAIIVLGSWRFFSWFGKEIVVPSRDKAFSHLDQVNTTMKDISASLSKLSIVPERLDRIEQKVDTLGNRVDKIDEHLTLQDNKSISKNS